MLMHRLQNIQCPHGAKTVGGELSETEGLDQVRSWRPRANLDDLVSGAPA